MDEINKLIVSFNDDRSVFFKDIGKVFLNEDGTASTEKMAADYIHLNKDGYRAWAESIEPTLMELL